MNDKERLDEARVLVLPDTGDRDRPGPERERALSALAEARVKVRHDSGGRLLVVEGTERSVRELGEQLPGVEVLELDESVVDRMGGMDPQDTLFARALAVRLSPEYRRIKSEQVPGESPEEQLLRSAPCTPPED